MSCAVLAAATGVSLRTIQRVLAGEEKDPGFSTVAAIAEALGIPLRLDEQTDLNTVRTQQAKRKAQRLLAQVKGTSALEAQAIHDDTADELLQRTVKELLAGSNRKLWAD